MLGAQRRTVVLRQGLDKTCVMTIVTMALCATLTYGNEILPKDMHAASAFELEALAQHIRELRVPHTQKQTSTQIPFHPNPQSLLDGMQIGFVNVGTGNLTFRSHDIPSALGMMHFSRIYDSRLDGDSSDFGRGWRLSSAEELRLTGGVATYIDEAGVKYRFRSVDDAFRIDPVIVKHANTRIRKLDHSILLESADGATRWFDHQNGDSFHLTRIQSATGDGAVLSYRDALLESIVTNHGLAVDILRHRTGRVASVVRNDGSYADYAYDDLGRLTDVRDSAGNIWLNKYDDEGRLVTISYSNDQPLVEAMYDSQGRVAMLISDVQFAFEYAPNRTVVSNPWARYFFDQASTGVTVAFQSTHGLSWNLANDDRNREAAPPLGQTNIGVGDRTAITVPQGHFQYHRTGPTPQSSIALRNPIPAEHPPLTHLSPITFTVYMRSDSKPPTPPPSRTSPPHGWSSYLPSGSPVWWSEGRWQHYPHFSYRSRPTGQRIIFLEPQRFPYYVGTCLRPVLGLQIPSWVSGTIRDWIDEHYPDHATVRVLEYANNTVGHVTRGYFSVNATSALFGAIWDILQGYVSFDENLNVIVDPNDIDKLTYVAGEVRDEQVDDSTCLVYATRNARYDEVEERLRNSDWNRYNLFVRNCNHWSDHQLR